MLVWSRGTGRSGRRAPRIAQPSKRRWRIKTNPGTYTLVFSSPGTRSIRVGRLGGLRVEPGFYVYVGSAFGPGGVRGRLTRHLRPMKRPHWHVDYLKRVARLEEAWYSYDTVPREHNWARILGHLRGARIPKRGFGSSDCSCHAHLFFFDTHPSVAKFRRAVRGANLGHSPISRRKFLDQADARRANG